MALGSLLGGLKNLAAQSGLIGWGSASLHDAYLLEKAPREPGVYQVLYRGQLMKIGKAADGLRKRFSDYYRGTEGGTAGLKYITPDNRDQVMVRWIPCNASRARGIETMLYDAAKARGEPLPWSERR